MKKLAYRALLGFVLALLFVNVGAITQGAPRFIYVYSESMEPLMRINDGFLVLPAFNFSLNDIIVYKPLKIEALLVTHRIVGRGAKGYITQGDNSPVTDQAAGEPEITPDRIVGRAFAPGGRPLVIPGLGIVYQNIFQHLGLNAKYLAIGLIITGTMLSIREMTSAHGKKRQRHRWRLRDVYRLFAVIALVCVVLGVLLGARTHQIKYLVSANPGTRGDHIHVDEPGHLSVTVRNIGFLPTWHISTALAPLSVEHAPPMIWPRSEAEITVALSPQQVTGWYQGYIQVYNYPMVLPRPLLFWLHERNPLLAVGVLYCSFALFLVLVLRVIDEIPGIEGWIPLSALKNKLTERRVQRLLGRLAGRRRLKNR